MIKLYRRLKEMGVMSINQRNADFVLKYNKRHLYPLVDDKLKTKKMAIAANIRVPPLFHVIESEHQLKCLEDKLATCQDFVIKPARGAGGDGIIVITDKVFGRYRQINGKLMSLQTLKHHISNILSGAFSLGGHPDTAIIEHRVKVDPVFANVSYEGIPDIRVIVLLGYPAMAMLRLPTRQSGGKANLHQGAIGTGIHLATGKTLGGVFQNDIIDCHPDTMNSIVGIEIPYWHDVLEIAASSFELCGLGYLGVDIVLDEQHGPLLLELNARPGLNIQIANGEGVLHRYRTIEKRASSHQHEHISHRISFSQASFIR